MDSARAHEISGMDQVISENLQSCIEDIFDERGEYMTEDACDFILSLEALGSCEGKTTEGIIKNTIETSKERLYELSETEIPINQLINIKSNMGYQSHIIDNQPLPGVVVFSTLYDKGYIKDSYMQKRVASQLQTLRSTVSDLMGTDRVSRALRPNTSRMLVSDWIDSQSVTNWNNKLIEGSVTELPSVESLVSAILPPLDCLEQSIVDGTYDDMIVNTLTSYTMATVVALIVKQELEKTKGYFERLEDLISFQRNFGLNGFLVMNIMAVNLAFAIRLCQDRSECERLGGNGSFEECLEMLQKYARMFEQWTKVEKNLSILLPSKYIYPKELASLMRKIQDVFGFSISEEAADWHNHMGIPIPITMQCLYVPEPMDGSCDNMLEESAKIGLGLAEIEDMASLMESETAEEVRTSCLDSLTDKFQVESEQHQSANLFESLPVLRIHRTIMEHQNRLFNNALRYDRDALKTSLAENLLMLEWLEPIVASDSKLSTGERKLLTEDVVQMGYQNRKYIDVVETDSMESLQAYVNDSRGNLTNVIAAIVNGV